MNKNYIVKTVRVHLSDIVETDLEGFLDILSEQAIGSPLLMDINYRVVGHEGDVLLIEVTGDESEHLNCEQNNEP